MSRHFFKHQGHQIDWCHIFVSYASLDIKCLIMTNDALTGQIWAKNVFVKLRIFFLFKFWKSFVFLKQEISTQQTASLDSWHNNEDLRGEDKIWQCIFFADTLTLSMKLYVVVVLVKPLTVEMLQGSTNTIFITMKLSLKT